MSLVKYRLKEVATDFGVTPKDIAQIMEQFFEKPKSNTQVLTEEELNVIFDVITAKNQISDLSVVFAVKPKEAPKPEPKAEAPKAEAPKPEAPKPEEKTAAPQQPKAEAPKPQKPQKPR